MSGWTPSKPPWETSAQPVLPPDGSDYSRRQGARVVIKPHANARGPRAGRGYQPSPGPSRGLVLFGVLAGLAASVGLTYGAVQMTHVTWGAPGGSGASAPASPAAVTAPASPAGTGAPASPASAPATAGSNLGSPAWTMTVPATAGGYHKHAPMPAAMVATGTKNATALMSAVELAGGKPVMAGKQPKFVSADYLVPGNQAIGYVGFTGAFDPASVMTAFATIADNVSAEPAGGHGGKLACGGMSADNGPSGTVCVWATTSSLGMVGFFGNGAPEHVPSAKAAEDTVKLRGAVEVALSPGG
jgi:hypothetical protein